MKVKICCIPSVGEARLAVVAGASAIGLVSAMPSGPGVDELLGQRPDEFLALPVEERYARFFEHFIDGLRARPLTLEVLASEVMERNELTAILETEREQWGEQAARTLAGPQWETLPHLRGVTLLLIAGVQYLLLRSRKIRIFGGLNLQSDEGWAELKASVRQLAKQMLAGGLRRRPV